MYAPSRIMTNDDLSKIVDTSDEWIASRTGIRERRIAADDETTTTLATHASRDALAVAGVDPADVDLVIVATASPDYLMPATGGARRARPGRHPRRRLRPQRRLLGLRLRPRRGRQLRDQRHVPPGAGRGRGPAEPLPGLDRSEHLRPVRRRGRRGPAVRRPKDRAGCSASACSATAPASEGIIIPGGGTAHPATAETVRDRLHFMRMAGKEVYRSATRQLAETTAAAVSDAGLRMDDIDLFLYHQANLRILETVRDLLGIPGEKVFVNLDRYGNTSAASVPMALAEAVAAGRVQVGDRLLMGAFGAGYTAGAAVLEWTADPARAFLAPGEQTRAGQPRREPVAAGSA